jgi:hypothetical protein
MLFMSQEHVDAMNALLADSEVVRDACRQLSRPRTIGYLLHDGPDGGPVHWRMSFADTVRFDLQQGETDVLFAGDWAQMIRASRANREQQSVDPGLVVEGEPAVLEEVGPALDTARSVATVPVDFPEV